MKTQLLAEHGGQRTFALILDIGDEVMSCLKQFSNEQGLSAAQLSAIGAFSDAELAYFNWERKDYDRIPIKEQVEVASLSGDVAVSPDGARAIHIHAVLGRRDGTALAGHLMKGHARPTLEVVLTESPVHLRKKHDPTTGLTLISLKNETRGAG